MTEQNIAFTAHKRREPLHPDITEEMIRTLVHGFYDRIQSHDTLGPIFGREIQDWDEHLPKMCDFWSSVMLKTGRFKGKPMVAHMRLEGVSEQNFDEWLALWKQAADDFTTPGSAPFFYERAEMIAAGLKNGMFFDPAKLDPNN